MKASQELIQKFRPVSFRNIKWFHRRVTNNFVVNSCNNLVVKTFFWFSKINNREREKRNNNQDKLKSISEHWIYFVCRIHVLVACAAVHSSTSTRTYVCTSISRHDGLTFFPSSVFEGFKFDLRTALWMNMNMVFLHRHYKWVIKCNYIPTPGLLPHPAKGKSYKVNWKTFPKQTLRRQFCTQNRTHRCREHLLISRVKLWYWALSSIKNKLTDPCACACAYTYTYETIYPFRWRRSGCFKSFKLSCVYTNTYTNDSQSSSKSLPDVPFLCCWAKAT